MIRQTTFASNISLLTATTEKTFSLVGLRLVQPFKQTNRCAHGINDAWQWIGYSRKSDAKEVLEASFDRGSDFCGILRKNGLRGRSIEKIYMTVAKRANLHLIRS